MEYTDEQITNGKEVYFKHKQHVDGLVKNEISSYPCALEDRSQPLLWKPQHWNWFLKKYIITKGSIKARYH